MLRLIAVRLIWAIPLLLAASLITFVLVALAPGDAARTILGATATQAQVDALRESLGLNQPLWLQYLQWLGNALRGDLGDSLVSRQPVTELIASRLPVTLSLAIGATVVCAVIGIVLGTVSATRGRVGSGVTDGVAVLGIALPNFWVGIVLVAVFSVWLGLLPATGYVAFAKSPELWARSLVLPVVTLAVGGVTLIAKQTRDAMRETLGRDFIDSLRADGWSERRIVWRHGLRNAAIPIVTGIGVFFTGLLGGTVLVENVFAMPGLGGAAVTAAVGHDLPLIQGIVLTYCVIVIVVNLVVDVLYAWLDPKVRVPR
ncbi:MAG: ABC transporter permease [Microbacterium sp.]|uniref:ABC transporter permease n=1 Tax=Microbacterium sp. TaxID=51671 RepID=UPI0039E55BEB